MSGRQSAFRPMERSDVELLRDESRTVGRADMVAFPRNAGELRAAMAESARLQAQVTVQGSRTGIAGGAVPRGGAVVNVSRMNRILGLRNCGAAGGFVVEVEAGVLLSQLDQALESLDFDTGEWSVESLAALDALRSSPRHFFPPDPTEQTASVGGAVSCNASGSRSFMYGATRSYVQGLEVVLADGSAIRMERGREKASGLNFSIRAGERILEGRLPGYEMPMVKNAAGYYVREGMDLIDLFIGSEGTLGVIAAVELRLVPAPGGRCGAMIFFPDERDALAFVNIARSPEAIRPAAIEFFDAGALNLVRKFGAEGLLPAGIPVPPVGAGPAVFLEYLGADEEVGEAIERLGETLGEFGADEDATWLADTEREAGRLRDFRHAVPEAVNMVVGERRKREPALTKLGTDMAVPDDRLFDVVELYRRGLEKSGLESAIFGHIGDNHLHVNILPNNLDEYQRGKALYMDWAERVVGMGGTVSAEHGIGKLKIKLLEVMYGAESVRLMQAVKQVFDPDNRLNRGNLFDS